MASVLTVFALVVGLPVRAADSPDPFAQARSLRAAGRLDEALEALRVESREIKRIEGESSPRLLLVNDIAAEILIDQGSLEKAGELLEKTVAQRTKLITTGRLDQNTGLGVSLLTVARLDAIENRHPEAADACRRAVIAFDTGSGPNSDDVRRGADAVAERLAALDDLLGPASPPTRLAREQTAATFESLGMFPDAIQQRKRMLDAIAQESAGDPQAAIDESSRLGRTMLLGGQAAEAAVIQARTIDATAPDGAPGSDGRLEAVALLGEFQIAAESFVEAEGTLGDLWETVVAAKQDASRTGLRIRLLGLLAAARGGRVTQLPDWFAAATTSLGRGSQLDAVAGAEGLLVAAAVQEELGLRDQSAELLARAVAVAQTAKPPDPGLVARCSARLAAASLTAGDVPAARKLLMKAMPAAEAALGPGEPGLVALQLAQADCLAREAKLAEARDLALRILARGLPRPSNTQEDETVAVFDRLAEKLNTADLDLRENFIAARIRQFGETAPAVAAAAQFFGAARLAAGDWPRAVQFLARAADLQQRSLASDHPDLAASLLLLGRAQWAAGDDRAAMESLTRSHATWKQAAGDAHPGTLAAMESLAEVCAATGDRERAEDLLARIVEADALEADGDPIAKASHLVRLADLLAPHEKAHGRESLEAAMALPCWTAAGGARDRSATRRLALTAALAAHAFGLLGDRDQAADMLRRGRALAVELGDSKELLERVETTAVKGQVGTTSR